MFSPSPLAEPGHAVGLARAALPTRHGQFQIAVYEVPGSDAEISALLYGAADGQLPLVRLHSECLTGDTFGSLRCDCGEQLDAALERIARSGYGVLLYLRQEGRGIGLANKIRAYALQEQGLDTVDANLALGLPADGRDYRAAADVLAALGMRRIRLLTNNPTKRQALERHGIKVMERVSLVMPPNASNLAYLHTKASRMGHLLDQDEQAEPADSPPASRIQAPASQVQAPASQIQAPASQVQAPDAGLR